MQPIPLMNTTLTRLVGLAFVIALVTALQMAFGVGFVESFIRGHVSFETLGLLVVMTVGGTAAIVSGFAITLKFDLRRVIATFAFCSLSLNASIYTSHSVGKWPQLLFFTATNLGWLIYVFTTTYIAASLTNIPKRFAWNLAAGVSAFLTFLLCIPFFVRSWVGLDTLVKAGPILRDLSMTLGFLAFASAMAFYRPFQLDHRSPLASLLLRLPSKRDDKIVFLSFLSLGAGLLLNLCLVGLAQITGLESFTSLSSMPWSWIGIFFLSLSELNQLSREQKAGGFSVKLTPKAAQRLLMRHTGTATNLAMTVGMKTANFVLDHDPKNQLQERLPSTILHIRAEEIHKAISGILRNMELVNRLQGSRVVGALDPEFSIRPCIDTLLMYACLYIDVGPLVERRMKGLASLFPIIDPMLTNIVNPDDLNQLMRRLEWFFYLDFAWTDQVLISSHTTTRFDVALAGLSTQDRHLIVQAVNSSDSIGGQIWLTPEARERLVQEAPQLRSIINVSPVQHPGTHEETLLFTIRFERLIPMLQRYFGLDQLRRSLLDFDPSPAHNRMLNLLHLQLTRAISPSEITEVLASLTTVPWTGYKEKDAALKLITLAHMRLRDHLAPNGALHSAESQEAKAAHELIQKAVQKVGYPSQIFHNAHMTKLALRNVKPLLEVASQTHHPRFVEAWMLLSTLDYRRMTSGQRLDIATFIKSLASLRKMSRISLVQAKAVDAWSNLCRSGEMAELPEYEKVFDALFLWFADQRVELDLVSLLLDALTFVQSVHGELVTPGEDILPKIESYITRETAKLDPNHSVVLSLHARLQNLRIKKSQAA